MMHISQGLLPLDSSLWYIADD